MAPRQKSSAVDGGYRKTSEDIGPHPALAVDLVTANIGAESTQATTPRRSTRLVKTEEIPSVKQSETATTSDNSEPTVRVRAEQAAMGLNPAALGAPASPESNTTASDGEAFRHESEDDSKGVQHVLQGLARMERRLQRMTKRQRLKVEESINTVVALQPRLAQRDHESRDESPATRGRQGQMSIKAQASAAAAPDHSMAANLYGRSSSDREAGGSRHALKETGSAEVLIKKPTPTASPADRGAARAPPVNSDILPLPWKGRLGYACLNTYLRSGRTPVFSSRTCRMASIIDHRYPLSDPTQPEHPTRNRPDKSKVADRARGLKFVQDLGMANARDIVKMLRWNERYGIRFMRLSSEMFPFASHNEHGYKLAPFASEVLAETGRVAAELGHRLTTHPGQFTQLGSPRPEVISAAVRDLEYHDEMLTLLKLPDQLDRDAVMILHLGGVYGDKAATLDRFRHNYKSLSDSIKRRLVLENDDVSWSAHDLLPLCEELNIPMVLDYHHHNIVFDPDKCREGTADLVPLMPRIRKTWERKAITMKMHYSEQCPGAVTPRDRRKHSPRVATLPPCPPDMDLMIEAKDKEQAVFELMRNFRLLGHERISCIIPHKRVDEPEPDEPPRSARAASDARKKQVGGGGRRNKNDDKAGQKLSADDARKQGEDADRVAQEAAAAVRPQMADEEIGMGGPDGRVYWPPGMEEWLRPLKRDQKRKFEAYEVYDYGDVDDT